MSSINSIRNTPVAPSSESATPASAKSQLPAQSDSFEKKVSQQGQQAIDSIKKHGHDALEALKETEQRVAIGALDVANRAYQRLDKFAHDVNSKSHELANRAGVKLRSVMDRIHQAGHKAKEKVEQKAQDIAGQPETASKAESPKI